MFSKRLIALRKEKQLSQYEIADRLGFSRGQYANYEQGTREPDFDTLQKLADFFDVSTDYLLGRTDIRNTDKQPEGRFFHNLDIATQEDLEELDRYFEFMQERKKRRENKDTE